MGKYFEELSRDLARGVSRREALWRFATGITAAMGVLFMGRPVTAQRRHACVEFCREQGLIGADLEECIAQSAHCSPGYCAMVINDAFVCVPVETGNDVCVEFCREQGLSGREFGECVAASAHCPDGCCAMLVNGTYTCVAVD